MGVQTRGDAGHSWNGTGEGRIVRAVETVSGFRGNTGNVTGNPFREKGDGSLPRVCLWGPVPTRGNAGRGVYGRPSLGGVSGRDKGVLTGVPVLGPRRRGEVGVAGPVSKTRVETRDVPGRETTPMTAAT